MVASATGYIVQCMQNSCVIRWAPHASWVATPYLLCTEKIYQTGTHGSTKMGEEEEWGGRLADGDQMKMKMKIVNEKMQNEQQMKM